MTALPSQNYAQVNNRPDPLGVTVVDGGVTEVKRVLRSGGASFASITVEFGSAAFI
jgi:hypothetical protein